MITEHKSYMIGEAPKKRHLLHVTCAPCSPRPSLCSAEKQKKIMPGGGGYSSEFLVGGGGAGVCHLVLQTLTLFLTKICGFSTNFRSNYIILVEEMEAI